MVEKILSRFKRFEIVSHRWSPNSIIGFEDVPHPTKPGKTMEKRVFLIHASQDLEKKDGNLLLEYLKKYFEDVAGFKDPKSEIPGC